MQIRCEISSIGLVVGDEAGTAFTKPHGLLSQIGSYRYTAEPSTKERRDNSTAYSTTFQCLHEDKKNLIKK